MSELSPEDLRVRQMFIEQDNERCHSDLYGSSDCICPQCTPDNSGRKMYSPVNAEKSCL